MRRWRPAGRSRRSSPAARLADAGAGRSSTPTADRAATGADRREHGRQHGCEASEPLRPPERFGVSTGTVDGVAGAGSYQRSGVTGVLSLHERAQSARGSGLGCSWLPAGPYGSTGAAAGQVGHRAPPRRVGRSGRRRGRPMRRSGRVLVGRIVGVAPSDRPGRPAGRGRGVGVARVRRA
jgi:hypothetical protein